MHFVITFWITSLGDHTDVVVYRQEEKLPSDRKLKVVQSHKEQVLNLQIRHFVLPQLSAIYNYPFKLVKTVRKIDRNCDLFDNC